MNAIAYMKDQFPAEAGLQLHPVITSCGGSVNVIPEEAVLETLYPGQHTGDASGSGEEI